MTLPALPGSITFTAEDRQQLVVTATSSGSPVPLHDDPSLLSVSDGEINAGAGTTVSRVFWLPAGTYTFSVSDRGGPVPVYGPADSAITAGGSTVIPAFGGGGGVAGLSIGAGLPSGGALGNFYLRTDTPSVANQRLYVAGPAASSPVFRAGSAVTVIGEGGSPIPMNVAIPAVVQVGDFMLIVIPWFGGAPTTVPAGWTLLRTDAATVADAGLTAHQSVYWKVAASGDVGGTGTANFVMPPSQFVVLGFVAYSNTTGISVSGAAVASVASASLVSSSVAVPAGNALVVKAFAAIDGNGAQTALVGPATQRVSVLDRLAVCALDITDRGQAAPGASVVETATASGVPSFVVETIVLAGAASSGVAWVGIA